MRRLLTCWCLCLCLIMSQSSFAMLSMELTRGMAGAVPIVIMPFSNPNAPQDVSAIMSNDLKNSGRFKVYNDVASTSGVENVVTGQVQEISPNQYKVSFQLRDIIKGKLAKNNPPILSKTLVVPGARLRSLAHHFSDLIYQHALGVRGIFSTRLAYILVKRDGPHARYILEVSDQDGYNPRALLTSPEPIMSPAWSPDGKRLAYVSFEKKQPSIIVQDIASGVREKVSSFPGINGAPAWSPDGRKLAIVLSKDGTPNIYVLNLANRQLARITQDWSINTEPAWSPDGRSLIFTSNRSGGPQIYQKNLVSGKTTRLTYEGNYNARASFAAEDNHIVLLNREASLFNVGILNLDTGILRVLTTSSGTDNESPSVAPNGSMVLYGTLYDGRSILAMAATDGSVQLRLPARDGDVQDPAWSPFLG